MLCATACPAHCIDIVGATAPPTWPDREKYPENFVIDELRCIYCGMCEEACPVEAIELTGLYDLTGLSREEMIFDKTKLLSVFDRPRTTSRCGTASRRPSPASSNQDLAVARSDRLTRRRGDRKAPRCRLLSVLAGCRLSVPSAPTGCCRTGTGWRQPRQAARGSASSWPVLALLSSWLQPVPAGPFLPTCSSISSASPRSSVPCLTVTSRNPIYSALWFASVVLSTSGLFLLAGAPFLAAGTIIVYAGAIIVTFLFVIMLAQMEGKALYDRAARRPGAATFTCFLLFWCLIYSL